MNVQIPGDRLQAFVEACRRVAGYGLVRCSSGNLSCRLDDENMLVSGTQTWLERIEPREVAVLRISDGAALTDIKPSVESRFHAGILRARPDVSVVLHFQSIAATTLACAGADHASHVIIETPYYIGPVAWAPFRMPGTAELAEQVIAAAVKHDMIQMRNHGQVTVGRTFDEAIQRAVFYEFACEIVLRAGNRLDPLPDDAIKALRESALGGGAA